MNKNNEKQIYEIDEDMLGSSYIGGINGLYKMKEILERKDPNFEIVVITDFANGAKNSIEFDDKIWSEALEELPDEFLD